MNWKGDEVNENKLPHQEMMRDLSSQHDHVAGLIGNKPFHYVDIPVHGNIGDILIMLGTMAFFRKYALKPRLISPVFAFDPAWIKPDDVVVFHGGGNFGDLYSEYGFQPLRERVVREKPHNRIIILPQTIYFSSPEAMAASAKIFRTHPDVHLFVRDRQSYEYAQAFTDHAYLVPDMAHHLYPIEPTAVPSSGVLRISRVDDEKPETDEGAEQGQYARITDWPELVGTDEKNIDFFRRVMRKLHRHGLSRLGNHIFSRLWIAYSGYLTKRAVGIFSTHEKVVTDRLHGHILACLMNKPNTVVDNSYGKNSSYLRQWTGNSGIVDLRSGIPPR